MSFLVVDSHCHLDYEGLADRLPEVLANAEAAGVGLVVSIGTQVRKFDRLLRIAEDNANVFCTVGTHPHHAHEEPDVTVADLVALAKHPKVVGIGEAGLDYHYDLSPRAAQEQGFRTHIAAARESGLPLVIHAREADSDVARILEEEMSRGKFKPLLHCFTSSMELAKRGLAFGAYVSFSGILTYKSAENLRAVAIEVPMDRLLVETDSPYLAPVPHRGQSNEPAFVVETLRQLAGVKNVTVEAMAKATNDNFFRLFSQDSPAGEVFMTTTLTILGCGSSGGVPRVGGDWGLCDSANAKNRRRRCSVMLERAGTSGTTRVLIDTSPDLREQMLSANVGEIDGVWFTHEHADHTHGIDELRGFFLRQRRRVPIWADEPTMAMLKRRFSYCFETIAGSDYPPILKPNPIVVGHDIAIAGAGGSISASPFPVHHGHLDALGYRFGNTAYTPDLNGVPDASVPYLSNLDLWIVDALKRGPHPSHFCLEDTLNAIARFKPQRAILTNMHIDMDYDTLRAELPAGVEPAYDGLKLPL